MARKVKIGVINVEVSKNEAKEVQRLMLFAGNERQSKFDHWVNASPSPEARGRRIACGMAMGLKVPHDIADIVLLAKEQ